MSFRQSKYVAALFLSLLLGLTASPALSPAAPPLSNKTVSLVRDGAGLLTPHELARLKTLIRSGEAVTGDQFVIFLTPALGTAHPDGDKYASEILRKDGAGWQGKPGVVLLVALQEKRAWIRPGMSLENLLSPGLRQMIAERVIAPNLQRGQLSKGLEDGTRAIAMALQGGFAAAPEAAMPETPTAATEALDAVTGLSIPNWMPILAACVFLFGLLNSAGWSRGSNAGSNSRYGGGRARW